MLSSSNGNEQESKRRPISICMFTSSSSAASSSLPCALSDVDVYDVDVMQITFPAFNIVDAHAHSKPKKGWPELRVGGKPQSHLFFGAA